MPPRVTFSDDDLVAAIRTATSWRQLAISLGFRAAPDAQTRARVRSRAEAIGLDVFRLDAPWAMPRDKACTGCGQVKPLDDFPVRSTRRDGRQSRCFVCQRSAVRAHYEDNRAYYIDKARTRKQELREINRTWVGEYLRRNPCTDCGEGDIRCLQFDHVRGVKRDHVSTMICAPKSLAEIQAEVAKCEVRCANCHARRTAEQFGWWREGDQTTGQPPGFDSLRRHPARPA